MVPHCAGAATVLDTSPDFYLLGRGHLSTAAIGQQETAVKPRFGFGRIKLKMFYHAVLRVGFLHKTNH